MTNRLRWVLMTAALFGLATLASAAKPNFSGEWKVNNAKSDFGGMPAPSAMTQKVTHADPALKVAVKVSSDNGDFDFEASYTTDGKESTNQMMGSDMKSVLKWEGDVLVIDTKGRFGDADVTFQDKWQLSEDGKTLTTNGTFSGPQGEMKRKLVFEKK